MYLLTTDSIYKLKTKKKLSMKKFLQKLLKIFFSHNASFKFTQVQLLFYLPSCQLQFHFIFVKEMKFVEFELNLKRSVVE